MKISIQETPQYAFIEKMDAFLTILARRTEYVWQTSWHILSTINISTSLYTAKSYIRPQSSENVQLKSTDLCSGTVVSRNVYKYGLVIWNQRNDYVLER